MGKSAREDGNERRREITPHSFRRFVKTTISDLGYQDFSEYGHKLYVKPLNYREYLIISRHRLNISNKFYNKSK